MTKAKESTLLTYRAQLQWGNRKDLPAIPGMNIAGVIKEYRIPAIRWAYSGSLIGIETKRQFLFWRDVGGELVFKGLLNKKVEDEQPELNDDEEEELGNNGEPIKPIDDRGYNELY